MKFSDLRNAASGLDVQDLPVKLIVVGLLPFLVSLIILISIPGIERKLLTHSLIVVAVLWAVGGATSAAFQYFEEREGAGRAAATRSLVWVAGLLLPIVVTVAILSRVH